MARAKRPAELAAKTKAVGSRQSAVAADAELEAKHSSGGKTVEPGESGEVVTDAEAVDGTAGEVVELSNDVDAGPPRSMADDLKDVAAAAGYATSPAENALLGVKFDNALLALELEAENHPQGRQGCMIFDPPRVLPAALTFIVDDGVWKRCGGLWQFWINRGGIMKMIRADMIHLREPPENVRELAA